MVIDTLEAIQVGGSTQWIRIRGTDRSNPVLLLIQQGPGLPMINEVRRFERELGLEQAFTVVYWDQRGCGRSLRKRQDRVGMSVERMVDDTVELLDLLRDRFGGEMFVVGFSLGGAVAANAVARRPDHVAMLVTVSTDIDGVAAATGAYDFALDTARQRNNRRAIRQLMAAGPPPHLEVKQFSTRARWVANFGGVTTNETYGSLVRGLLASLLRSSDYSAGDVVRTVRGLTTTTAPLLPELADLDLVRTLPRLDVPIVMVQGRHDHVGPGEAAERFARSVEAPSKRLVWFEHSAHTPQLDEPDRFRDLLLELRDRRPEDLTVDGTNGGRS